MHIYAALWGVYFYIHECQSRDRPISTGPNDTFEFNLTTVEVFWDLIKMEEFYYSEIGGI